MNTIHNNGENDQKLNSDLDELGQAYSKLEQDEPPALLDQAILNSAHRAVENKPHWMQFGWLHGLTTTAVFVLALSIFLNQRQSVPIFKDDVLINAPSVLETETALKKQSVDKVSEYRQYSELKSKSELATPATQPEELSELRERRAEPLQAQRSLRVESATLGKSERDDNDLLSADELNEEIIMTEAEMMSDAPAAGAVHIPASPTAAFEPASSAMQAREQTEPTIDQELEAIIALKNAADESWITKLEAFVERYPDFPLPDELKD